MPAAGVGRDAAPCVSGIGSKDLVVDVNVNLLIDALVRQTTVLLAQLATAAGTRAPLAHTANQVFMDLVRELKDQGLGNKVIADMFGLTLRTYHNKIARLSESSTDRGRSLWEAVLGYIEEKGPIARAAVLARFGRDDVETVKGVLKDLVDSGLVYRTGRGDAITYCITSATETVRDADLEERNANLVWVAIFRYGPILRARLAEIVPLEDAAMDRALARLVSDGRVEQASDNDALSYSSTTCVIPVGDSAGWEAAVFDHYQAMVTAICRKLQGGTKTARPGEWIGGSTYHYDVWRGHPQFDEVVGFLSEVRERAVLLRKQVEAYNKGHEPDEQTALRVTAYVGQTIIGPEPGEDS
jgi:chromosome segregation and condensation protein ScpB